MRFVWHFALKESSLCCRLGFGSG